MVVKKPCLEDFGLSERLIQKYNEQKQHYSIESQRVYNQQVVRRKVTFFLTLLLSLVFLIINISTEFEVGFCVGMTSILFLWGSIYGLWLFQTSDDFKYYETWIWKTDKGKKMSTDLIDQSLESLVKKYEDALRNHEELKKNQNKDFIYEYSLIKFAFCGPVGANIRITKRDHQWMVFSNCYLSNAQFYPQLSEYDYLYHNEEFQENYNQIIEQQKMNPPILKDELNLSEPVHFYYPQSNMFACMEGKKAGDNVYLIEPYMKLRYKVIEVVNPTFE